MFENFKLKRRLEKLDIGIPVDLIFNMYYRNIEYLIENFESMTDDEIIEYVKRNYLKDKVEELLHLSGNNLEHVIKNLDSNVKYEYHLINIKDMKVYMKDCKDKEIKNATRFIMLDLDSKKHMYIIIYKNHILYSEEDFLVK